MAKLAPFDSNRFPGFRGAGPCVNFLGADALADCRTDCQGLWPGLVRAS